MSNEQFNAILPLISADLVSMICKKKSLSEHEAIKLLYGSKFYEILEDEETKLWQYSTPMLYSIFEKYEKGIIDFPDV